MGAVLVATGAEAVRLPSPDGRLVADIDGDSVSVAYDGKQVLSVSGFAALGSFAPQTAVRETFTVPFGENRSVRNDYNAVSGDGLEFRAYDAGLAWKARGDRGKYAFRFAEDARCWPVSHAQGEYKPLRLSEIGQQVAMPGFAPVAAGIGKMFNYDERYIVGGSCESPLVVEPTGFTVALGDAAVYGGARLRFANGGADGVVTSYLEGPREADAPSWKYVRVAKTPVELYAGNDMLLCLSRPSELKDAAFVKPGKVLRLAKLDTEVAHQAVDYIVANGLQYLELDAGWYGQEHSGDPLKPGLAPERVARGEKFDFFDILAYAKSRQVGVILYVNRAPLIKDWQNVLDQLKAWGVVGVKYGFLQVGSAEARAFSFKLIEEAAKRGLMVDIHDEMRYTGEQRTFPNMMTVEGICGNEEMPTPEHNAALVFTRYLTGPGDYTPCFAAVSDKRKPVYAQGTLAHQLALPATCFSPWQFLHWYSRPDQIPDNPALQFWREIPTVWDETKALDGVIGEYAVMARRSGKRWFLGALNSKERRTFKVSLDFIAGDAFKVRLYRDEDPSVTKSRAPVACEERIVCRGRDLVVEAAANGGFAAIVEAIEKEDALVAEDEHALSDRLLMHWQTHATDVFVRDQAVVGVGGKRAPVPTVVFAGNRSHVTDYKRPSCMSLNRREEDPRGLFLEPKDGSAKTWVAYGKTGGIVNSLNTEMMGIAVKAAGKGERTGDGRYVRLAYNALKTYMEGILHRNVATDLAHGHMQTLFGLQSMETIHDDIIYKCCDLYKALKPYIAKNHPEELAVLQAAFRKWADVQIANGVADNNWDMMQLNYILSIALVLEEPDRSHYVDVVMNQSTVRNLSVKELAKRGFDPETGIWWECPGYSVNVTVSDFATFEDRARKELGIELTKEIPVLEKAYAACGEYLFPDGMLIGFGDTHPSAIKDNIASRTTLKTSPFFYAPNASWLIARSGMDRTNDVAFALNGSLGNHQHANGISLELYAKGYRLAPDAGIGWSLYSGEDYKEYYSQFPAHNTVMVNSRSTYQVMKTYQPFELVDHGENWAKVSFREPATGADQERTVRYVKDDEGAYFVDVFRSKVANDSEQWHDYYYHNLGDKLTLNGPVRPTDKIAFVESGLYALSYIQDKFEREGEGDLVATFDWARPEGNVGMKVFMNGGKGRTFIQALAPATEGLSRCKDPDYGITRDSRTPTLVVRQHGEAWERPFIAVMDPSGTVKGVAYGPSSVRITRQSGRIDTFGF